MARATSKCYACHKAVMVFDGDAQYQCPACVEVFDIPGEDSIARQRAPKQCGPYGETNALLCDLETGDKFRLPGECYQTAGIIYRWKDVRKIGDGGRVMIHRPGLGFKSDWIASSEILYLGRPVLRY